MTDAVTPSPQSVNPDRLRTLLENVGWKVVGRREGLYYRLQPSNTSRSFVIIPVDTQSPDYADLIASAVAVLQSDFYDLWTRHIGPRLVSRPADSINFQKETGAVRGLIAWNDGQELVVSARATLLAGAKYFREPSRHFNGRFGQFASRYLDNVLMGQSSPGSYVITALAPLNAKVPLHHKAGDNLAIDGVDVVTCRSVTRSVADGLEATVAAISDYRHTSSFDAFEAGVNDGISYEMTSALRDITAQSDSAEISIEWSRTDDAEVQSSTQRFEFQGADAGILETASLQLASQPSEEPLTVRGRVHLLTKKQAHGRGVVGVDDGHRKFRVQLGTDEEYHSAVIAHDEEREVEISGTLSREGNINWLYGATLSRVIDPAPTATKQPSSMSGETLF